MASALTSSVCLASAARQEVNRTQHRTYISANRIRFLIVQCHTVSSLSVRLLLTLCVNKLDRLQSAPLQTNPFALQTTVIYVGGLLTFRRRLPV
jgi:hypothetical protein